MEDSGGNSRRRSHRRQTAAPVRVDPITQEEFHFEAIESRRRRRRRSATRSQSQSQASSSAPPVDGGSADPDPPTRPHGEGSLRDRSTMESANDNALWLAEGRNPNRPFSFSAAPRSEHSGAEGRMRVRQSFLDSDHPRHSRLRRLAGAQEHVTALSSIEPSSPAMNLPTFEALSLSQPRTRSHVRQSVLYSDRPRRSRPKRPALAEECTHEETSSELGQAVIELPVIEALSLSDPPLPTPQTEAGEETDDDCAWVPTAGQPVLYFSRPKGLSRSMIPSLADCLMTVPNDAEKRPKPYPDEDPEELLRRIEENLYARPFFDLSVSFDLFEATDNANLNAHAAELGTEPPSVLTDEQTSVAAERRGASTTWMEEEVMLCFKKLIEISPDIAELEDYCLGELCHQCFNVESYDKVYHHYNFTVRMKMPNSADWSVKLYFAEVKEIFRTKHYLCYPLDPNENGQCYACKNQGMEELRHPAIDLFETCSPDAFPCNLWYTYD